MKKITFYLVVSFLFISAFSFAQGTVTGTITDSDLGGPLSGANIIEEGTNNGAVSDFDGNFSLNVSNNSGAISITYLGYSSQSISFTLSNGSANLGTITLDLDADALGEIVIIGNGIIDLAGDRRTPMAVSTITASEIQLKVAGNVEFTEALKNMPSVYVSNQNGGFGDSAIYLRGFDDSNTAFLLNGQPINSVEDGRMFWSNWAGMADVATAVQVQRGLGASKLAISSVGGTVNIISKSTEKKQGGFVRLLGGNDSYIKGTFGYNSGLNESGWAFSFMIDHWQAHRKYSIGTAGQGQNYLFSVGYRPNDKHAFNFLITGAPQWHDQNFSDSLEDYEEHGQKQNANSGFLNGERFTERRNYYHKPVSNLNWDFEINESTNLSTVLYASWGRGGGTGSLGSSSNRVRKFNDEIDFDQIVLNNIASAENGIGNFSDSYIRRASVNNHNWYGLLSSLTIESGENWTFNVGFDSRLYSGDHFRQVNDLLGLSGFNDNRNTDRPDDYVFSQEFEANPWKSLTDFADEANRTQYDYSEDINYLGGSGQIEYADDSFSAFIQGAFSTQSYERQGRFSGNDSNNNDNDDGLGTSEKVDKTGYNVKGGLGYSIDGHHTFFGNAGYYSRQPYLDNIFVDIRNSNVLVSPDVDNEEITGYEAGYRYKGGKWRINVDVYRTEWGNRFVAAGGSLIIPNCKEGGGDCEIFFTDRFTDVTQIHQGVEVDISFRPDDRKWGMHWMTSIGNWKYDGETPFTRQDDDSGEFFDSGTLDLTGTKVGLAPQTTAGIGLNFNVCENITVDGSYIIYTDLYGFVDVDDVIEAAQAGEVYQAERLDAYLLGDVGLTYKFVFGDNDFTFRGNVYNVFNDFYISNRDRFGYQLGVGRTWNASLRYEF